MSAQDVRLSLPNGAVKTVVPSWVKLASDAEAIAQQILGVDAPLLLATQKDDVNWEVSVRDPSKVIFLTIAGVDEHPRVISKASGSLADVPRFLRSQFICFPPDGRPVPYEVQRGEKGAQIKIAPPWVRTTFVLPTKVRVVAFLADRSMARAFAEFYLGNVCECRWAFEVAPHTDDADTFVITLTNPPAGGSQPQPPSGVAVKWQEGDSVKWITWRFPRSTLPREAKEQVRDLIQGVTGWPAENIHITFPYGGPLVNNIRATAHLMRRTAVQVAYPTAAGTQTVKVPITINADSSGPELTAKLHRRVSKMDASYRADPAEVKVVVDGEKMKSIVAGDISPDAAIEIRVSSKDSIDVNFRYDDKTCTHKFAKTDTVRQAREFATHEYRLASVETTVLFYAARELADRQRLAGLRLRPGHFIIVATSDVGPVVLRSVHHIPAVREYRFACKEQNKRFVLPAADTDLIDRVKIHVAEKLSEGLDSVLDWRRVELWFKNRELLNDVAVEAIGIGSDGVIDVTILDPLVAPSALLARLSSGLLPLIRPSPSDDIDAEIEALYAQVSPANLKGIRGIMKARYGRRDDRPPEEDMIALYLRCNKNLQLFGKNLPP